MADVGLLVSIGLIVIIVSVFVRPWPPDAIAGGVVDTAMGAALIGLVVGRVAAVALDDPGALTKLNDLLIIRSGVEFWPGVAAGLAWLLIRVRRKHIRPWNQLAALAPGGLVAWAVYEATCVVRGGCPGPVSAVGLHPDGLTRGVFPIGLAVGAVAGACAVLLGVAQRRGLSSRRVVIAAITAVAAIRSVASLWLPHIGSGFTRQHRTSLVVAIAGFGALSADLLASRRAHPEPSPA